jgi:hypothetical protein
MPPRRRNVGFSITPYRHANYGRQQSACSVVYAIAAPHRGLQWWSQDRGLRVPGLDPRYTPSKREKPVGPRLERICMLQNPAKQALTETASLESCATGLPSSYGQPTPEGYSIRASRASSPAASSGVRAGHRVQPGRACSVRRLTPAQKASHSP